MGLLLIYILSVPLLSIVKNSGAVIEDFSRNYNEEVSVLEKKETQNLQGFYIRKGFEQELTSQITKKCEESHRRYRRGADIGESDSRTEPGLTAGREAEG